MKSDINSKIISIEKFAIEDFSIDQLKRIHEEISSRKTNLEDRVDTILISLDQIKRSQDDSIKSFLPHNFSSPLRQVLTRNRELKNIKKLNERYDDELKQLDKLIQKKILDERLIDTLGSQAIVYLKETIITILIVLVLGAMFYEYNHINISRELSLQLFVFDFICCMIFLLNFFFELWLSDSKRWYWKSHWIDFITSIPIPDAKVLRAGRLLRLARLLRILRFLRFFRVILLLARGLESFKELFDMKLMKKTILYTFIFLFMGSFAIIYFEQKPENINTFIEGIWWSFTTIVTGGYGDIHNPISVGGMLVALILVIAGMVLIGVFIASLSAIINSENDDEIGFLKQYMDKRFTEIEDKIGNN